MRQSRRLLAAPAYLERQGVPATHGDLAQHTLLGLAGERPFWPLLDGGVVPIEPAHTVDDLYVLGCMVNAGLGIALMPRAGIGLDAGFDELVPVLEDDVGGEFVVRVFLPTRARAGDAARELLDLTLEMWRDADVQRS